MAMPGLEKQIVLVTGATKGLGKAIAMAFARSKATVFVTHKWGSVNEETLCNEFLSKKLAAPYIIQSDVSSHEDNLKLMEFIQEKAGGLDTIISNVSFSKIIHEMSDLKRKTLELFINYSAWPMVDLVICSEKIFNKYPRYILGISSDGADVCHPGYDMAGVSKAVLETFCKYMAIRLSEFNTTVNAIRPGMLVTDSSLQTFGKQVIEILYKKRPELFVEPDKVANVCLALCSGLMDVVNGQIITVDKGSSLISPITYFINNT